MVSITMKNLLRALVFVGAVLGSIEAQAVCTGQFNGGTICVNNSTSVGIPNPSATPTLGVPGSVLGSMTFSGSSSGSALLRPQAAAGTPTLLLPNTSGTLASTASTPLVLSATTGALTCPTCVTSSGGGGITGTAPIAVSGAGVVSINAPYASLTVSNGGIVYSGAANLAILAGTATAQQMLQSGASGAPSWSTAIWPATTTINQLLYSSAANTVVGLATVNSGVLITSAGGVPSISTTLPSALTIPSPTFTGTVAGAGTIPNSVLANSATTVNGQTCTLGSTCTVTAAASSIEAGVTVVTGGPGVLYNSSSGGTLVSSTTLPSGLTAPSFTVTTGFTATGLVGLTSLAAQATNSIVGNATSGSASPTALAIGSCSTASSALIWTTNTGFGCNTSITANAVPAANLTGTTLAASVVTSSLTTVGALGAGSATTGFTIAASNVTWTGTVPSANITDATNAAKGVMRGDTTTITCVAGVCTAVGAAATSVAIGTTTISSGTTNRILYDNAGVLGELIIGNGIENSAGTLGITAARRTLPTTQSCASGLTCDGTSRTYTTPSNVLWIEIYLVGPGGGGGAQGTGGSPTAGNAAANPTCWNTSGAACTSPVYAAGSGQGGGQGPGAANSGGSQGGAGGTISGSATPVWSVAGSVGNNASGGSSALYNGSSGAGGASCRGGAGLGGASTGGAAGGAGAARSGGGGGGGGPPAGGIGGSGGGGSGACLYAIINSPAGTYTYLGPAGGTAGTAGTGGGTAGAGGTSDIVVIEHYGT